MFHINGNCAVSLLLPGGKKLCPFEIEKVDELRERAYLEKIRIYDDNINACKAPATSVSVVLVSLKAYSCSCWRN
jgi:predicted phage-related endonuclease